MFRLVLHKRVVKFLEGADKKTKESCAIAFEMVSQNPKLKRPHCDIKKLSGKQEAYRLRVGNYRLTYVIDGDIVQFEDVFGRGRGYRS